VLLSADGMGGIAADLPAAVGYPEAVEVVEVAEFSAVAAAGSDSNGFLIDSAAHNDLFADLPAGEVFHVSEDDLPPVDSDGELLIHPDDILSGSGPVITAVDLVSQPGMVFHGNSTTPVDPGSASRIAIRSLITSSGMVNAEGALAIVTFDTTGIAGGTYPLKMSATVNGDSDFAGIPINIVNGSITIPIPPVPPDILLGVRNVSTGGTMMTEVSFTSASGWDHFIQFQDKLVSATGWQDLPNGPHNTGLLVDSPGARNTRFYRLRIVIQ
jgi:hypothetical protein